MKTFQIRNGDLVIGAGGYATLTGVPKVYQDLGILVREPLGEDRFHPQWGGILQEFIGRIITQDARTDVVNEIQRLTQNYIVMQSRQMTVDLSLNRRPRYSPEEIVVSLENVDVQQRGDRLNVKVTVSTASGEVVDIVRTVEF